MADLTDLRKQVREGPALPGLVPAATIRAPLGSLRMGRPAHDPGSSPESP